MRRGLRGAELAGPSVGGRHTEGGTLSGCSSPGGCPAHTAPRPGTSNPARMGKLRQGAWGTWSRFNAPRSPPRSCLDPDFAPGFQTYSLFGGLEEVKAPFPSLTVGP